LFVTNIKEAKVGLAVQTAADLSAQL